MSEARYGVVIRSPLGGLAQAVTSDGRTLRLDAKGALDLLLLDRRGELISRASLPFPWSGYGGHEIAVSPRETYVGLYLYSGQTQVGYELFELPTLRHFASMPYELGEGYGPVFSSDERFFVLATATNAGLYIDQDEDDIELDAHGRTVAPTVIDWAVVHLHPLPTGVTSMCRVRVRVPKGFAFERDDNSYPKNVSVSDAVRFEAPWGPIELPLQLPSEIVVEGPGRRDR